MKNYIVFTFVLLFLSCATEKKETPVTIEVDQTTLGKHMERLASDEFLGRKPFTEGEVKTVNYLEDEFKKIRS